MVSNAQSFREYLKRRQDTIEKNEEMAKSKSLHNEKTFFPALLKDMMAAKQEIIIYSPFISKFRLDCFSKSFNRLRYRNIEIFVFTRPLEEYDNLIRPQIEVALKRLEDAGISVIFAGRYIHEKVAIIDREILWEGSLNILAHRGSNEMMRRIESKELSAEVMEHINLNVHLTEAYKTKYERLCGGAFKY